MKKITVGVAVAIVALTSMLAGWVLVDGRATSGVPIVGSPVPRPTPVPADRLPVAGQPAFWAGLNYPWKTGQDFGTGAWGHSGVSDPTTYQEIDADFANMAAQGVRVVKWRVFSDGRYGLQFDENGVVSGLDDYFFKDVDAALEIANRHDMYLVFTLFSSGLWTADCQSGGVHLGGQAATLTDPVRRQALIDRAVVPLLQHIATSDRVVAIETIAEPEWGVAELNQQPDARIKLPLETLREFVDGLTRAIHQDTRSLATVESNRFSNMQNWQGLGLDYYSFSWYDWLEPYEPLATPASAANLDRPIVIGEYPAGGSAYYDVPTILDKAYALGYAGAFGWSYWGGDGVSRWHDVADTFNGWVAGHWRDVGLGGGLPPAPGSVAEQQYPYALQDLAVHVDDAGGGHAGGGDAGGGDAGAGDAGGGDAGGGDAVVAEVRIVVPSGEAYVPHAYLYQVGSTQPLQEVRLSAAPGAPGKLAARFTGVSEGPAYTVSLGIFDPAGSLRKWFNGVASFAVSDGTLTTPTIDTLTSELGCSA